MSTLETDSLGRATFDSIAPRARVRPTQRELHWMSHIARHGPQSSYYLYEQSRDTHRCKDSALRDMQKLRAGGFLSLPPQQRATEHAEFKPYVYDLTRQARDYLEDYGLSEPTVRPTGHWWHALAVSQVTSSIDIAAARAGVSYLPAPVILGLKGAEFAIPMERSTLIPDQLFALDYGGRFRAFVLEVDRGTEPKVSMSKRKSWSRSIEQYRALIERNGICAHYGLKANLMVLWVFTRVGLERRFRELTERRGVDLKKVLLTQTIDPEARDPHWQLFQNAWSMSGGREMSIEVG